MAAWSVFAIGFVGLPLGLFWFLKLRARRAEAELQLDRDEAAIRYP